MKYAEVRIGEMAIPLIGISPTAVEETCDKCKKVFHIQDIELLNCGMFLCEKCKFEIQTATKI